MAKAETLCPKCGFSPIPEGTEKCPRCGENFAFHPLYKAAQRKMLGKLDAIDTEATLMGGLTGAVTAHPSPAAGVMALCALLWLVRASGLVVDLGDPVWLFALAAADLGAASMLMATVGPARSLVQALAVVQIAVAVLLAPAGPWSPLALAFAAPGAVILFMTVAEPSGARRRLGLLLGVLSAVVAVAVLAWTTPVRGGGGPSTLKGEDGWLLVAPPGFGPLGAEDLAPLVTLPSTTNQARHLGFGHRAHQVFGVISVSTEGSPELRSGCEAWHRALGAVNEPRPLGPAPSAFGGQSVLFELRTRAGAAGRLACGLREGRLWALAVVTRDPAPAVGLAAFEELSRGLTLP